MNPSLLVDKRGQEILQEDLTPLNAQLQLKASACEFNEVMMVTYTLMIGFLISLPPFQFCVRALLTCVRALSYCVIALSTCV